MSTSPTHLLRRWTLPDRTPLTLRPVRPGDARRLHDLICGLPPRDRRWRFHGAVSCLAPEQLARMACADPLRETALVVTAPAAAGEQLVADARCVIDGTGQQAEFALMVSAAWRRRGIGQLALHELRRAAAARGLRWLYGTVLRDNLPMLALLRRNGFTCTPHRSDRTLMAVELLVQSPAIVQPESPHARLISSLRFIR